MEEIKESSKTPNITIRADKSLEWNGDPYQRSALSKRNADYLGNEFRADMWFHVQQNDVKIPAHRFVIGTASPVLESIAYGTGDLAGSIGDVPVRDCSAEDFYEVLRFVYTNVVNLTPLNVANILLLAHFYNLKSLEDECTALLQSTLSVRNVCDTFVKIHLLDNEPKADCLRIIQRNTDALFTDEQNLFDLDVEALRQVFKLDKLRIDEVDLFAELLKWGRTQCLVKELTVTAPNLRDSLEGRIEFVRFTAMTFQQFGRCVKMVQPHFFTDSEISATFQLIAECTDIPAIGLTNYTEPRKLYLEKNVENLPVLYDKIEICEFGFTIKCDGNYFLNGFERLPNASFTVEWCEKDPITTPSQMIPLGVKMFGDRALFNEPFRLTTCGYFKIIYPEKVWANYTIEDSCSWNNHDSMVLQSWDSKYPLHITFKCLLISKVN